MQASKARHYAPTQEKLVSLPEEGEVMSREQIKVSLLSQKEGIIEIRAYTAGDGSVTRVSPMEDPVTKWFKGVARLSEAEKANSSEGFVDPKDPESPLSNVDLRHLKTFDLANPSDRLVLTWLFECKNTLALSLAEGLKNPRVRFYVHQKDLETKKQIKKFAVIDQAIASLEDYPVEMLPDIAMLLGMSVGGMRPHEVKLALRTRVTEKDIRFAKLLNAAFNDVTKDRKLYLLEAIRRGIITRDLRGKVTYNDIFMGSSFPEALFTLASPKFEHTRVTIEEQMGRNYPDETLARPAKGDDPIVGALEEK